MSGRELFEAFLKGGRPGRPPFAPLLGALAARLGGVTQEAMTADPASWSGSLVKAADLFDVDAVVVGYDRALTADACGCPVEWRGDRASLSGPAQSLAAAPEEAGRMAVALETARRAFSVVRSRKACAAVLTGPVTLAEQLFGREEGALRLNDAKQALLRLTEAFCKLRPDLLLLLEGEALTGAEAPSAPWRRTYATLRNVAQYYDVPVAVWLEELRADDLERFLPLGADLLIAGRPVDGVPPSASVLAGLSGSPLGVGISLPLWDAEVSGAAISAWRKLAGGDSPPFFFTGAEPEGRSLDPEVLRRIGQAVRS